MATIWRSDKQSRVALEDVELLVGVYEFEFDTRLIPDFAIPDLRSRVGESHSIGGKRYKFLGYDYDVKPKIGVQSVTLKIEVTKNPVPALVLIGSLAVIIGLVAVAALREIRQVTNAAPLFGTGLGVLLIGGGILALGVGAARIRSAVS